MFYVFLSCHLDKKSFTFCAKWSSALHSVQNEVLHPQERVWRIKINALWFSKYLSSMGASSNLLFSWSWPINSTNILNGWSCLWLPTRRYMPVGKQTLGSKVSQRTGFHFLPSCDIFSSQLSWEYAMVGSCNIFLTWNSIFQRWESSRIYLSFAHIENYSSI